MRTSLKCALFFGIAPLVTGIAIFLGWALSRADWLMAAGVVTIYVGRCSVAVGAACLAIYLWKSWRSRTVRRRRLAWQATAVVVLFLANFIVAGAAVSWAMVIDSRYTVFVANQSDAPLESVRIEGGGVDISLGTVEPGKIVKRSFWIRHEGKLVLTGIHGTERIEATVDGYVSNSLGGDKAVVLGENGVVSSRDQRPGYLD